MLAEFLSREHTDHSKYPFPTTQETTHGHHQMANKEIRLIIFFVTKDEEALYNQKTQDLELTVAQIVSSSLQTSGLS